MAHHNCLTWCENQLAEIGIPNILNGPWLSRVIPYAPWAIPDGHNNNNNDEENDGSGAKCTVM